MLFNQFSEKPVKNEKNIKIISEIEFAYLNTKTPFIAITGTNGKTTTTALVSHILSKKFSAPVCGNIGVPPTSLIEENHDFIQADLIQLISSCASLERMYGNCKNDCIEKIKTYFDSI